MFIQNFNHLIKKAKLVDEANTKMTKLSFLKKLQPYYHNKLMNLASDKDEDLMSYDLQKMQQLLQKIERNRIIIDATTERESPSSSAKDEYQARPYRPKRGSSSNNWRNNSSNSSSSNTRSSNFKKYPNSQLNKKTTNYVKKEYSSQRPSSNKGKGKSQAQVECYSCGGCGIVVVWL